MMRDPLGRLAVPSCQEPAIWKGHRALLRAPFLMGLVLLAAALTGCEIGTGDAEDAEGASGTCEDRGIAIERVAEIGTGDDGGMLLSTVTNVSYLSDGRIAVFDWHDSGRVRVHEPDGRWAFNLGRPGEGPGELADPAFTHLDPEGNFVVVDSWQRRLTRFSDDGRTVLETTRLPPTGNITRVLPLPDGRMLVSAPFSTEEALGLPIHVLDRDGSLVHSFGGEVFGGWAEGSFNRVTSVAPDGKVWVAPRDQYRLELWDLDGTLLRTFDEEPEWFNSSSERRIPRSPDAPEPRSSMVGVWEDEGCLWVASNVARRDWPDRLEEADENSPLPLDSISPGHPSQRYFLTRVQLLDPETSEQVALVDAPTGFTGIRTTGPVGSPVIGFSNHLVRGEPRLWIWTLSMGGP